ncbi:hypothetical protein [Methanobrevibacter arboriphilus]|uniref:hypothetical protein n=1 Tax=Methanobrevibacter arboriphilus TaxID=39441 RepID=UPI0005B2BA50|nr:hypothetical protein [Methanobrevibacter arboriphilus]
MLEKAIENWLINANENNFRVPFSQVLINEGFTVFDTHGPSEKGKDILAIDKDNNYFAFQLKRGDIDLKEWQNMIPQIRELTYIDIHHPSFERGKSYTPILVTNGVIKNPAIESIKDYNLTLENDGRKKLSYHDKNFLLEKFNKSTNKFLLNDYEDFYSILDLLTHDGTDFFPKKKFTLLLNKVLFSNIPKRVSDKKDIISSSLIIVSYLIGSFQREKNYFAIFEAWVCLFALLIRFSRQSKILIEEIQISLNLIMSEIIENVELLKEELMSKKIFHSKIIDGENKNSHDSRVLIVLGTIVTLEIFNFIKDSNYDFDEEILQFIEKNIKNLFCWGESAIPFYFNLIKYLEINGKYDLAKYLIENIIKNIIEKNDPRNNFGLPNPYYHPKIILEALIFKELKQESLGINSILREIINIDTNKPFPEVFNDMRNVYRVRKSKINTTINKILDDANLVELDFNQFCGDSYMLESLILMLIRRDKRDFLEKNWKKISYVWLEEFEIDNEEDLFSWVTTEGNSNSRRYDMPCSYKKLIDESNEINNPFFDDLSFLYFFILVFPHRANKIILSYLDKSLN